MTTLYKTTRFDLIPIGTEFTWDQDDLKHTKLSARMAGNIANLIKPSTQVTIIDAEAMAKRATFLAKPLFDGTEASCRTRSDFYALSAAHRDVVRATEKVDVMADYIARKMADVKTAIRRNGAVDIEQRDRFADRLSIPPASISDYCGLNSCGELQGNGNIDMLIATLLAKRETFIALINALGYRLTEVQQ